MDVKIENLPGGRFYTTGDGIVTVNKRYRKRCGYKIKHKSKTTGQDVYAITCKDDVRHQLKILYPNHQQQLELT